MRITPENFFNHYIVDPLSKELSIFERVMSLVLSALLALPTLGILHIRAKWLQSKNIVDLTGLHQQRQTALRALANSINKVSFATLQPGQEKIRCTTTQVGKVVNERFIQPFYAKNLPSEEQVTVPFQGEWRRWQDLTRSQKIQVNNTGTREHNQLPALAPEAAVDRWFFAHGQAPFLPNDPRQSHGNDHAARASIFAAVFAYLYQKYHPNESVGMQDVTLAQIVAAGHDSGRQTEGPDVYDSKSAENTVEVLKRLGVTDAKVLHDAHEAIENKDSDPLTGKKSLIARCVQNADSAEFTRLILSSKVQEATSFESSKEYLDIYKELKSLPGLKEGQTFKQFVFELDALRKEINDLIYQTHKQDFRSKVAADGQNIYEAILQVVNPIEFPTLYAVLTHIGVKQKLPEPQVILEQHQVEEIASWISYGLDLIPKNSLEKLMSIAGGCSINEAKEAATQLEGEIMRRKAVEERFTTAKTLAELAIAYAHIPEVDRSIEEFQKKANILTRGVDIREALTKELSQLPGPHQKDARVALVDILQQELKIVHDDPDELVTKAQSLIVLYEDTSEPRRSHEVQTTLALALSLAARLFIQQGEKHKAQDALQIAADELQIEPSNKFHDLSRLLAREKEGDAILYESRDCGLLRKRKLGCQEKIVDGKKYHELSLEVPREVRKELNQVLNILVDDASKEIVPSQFYRKTGKEFVKGKDAIEIGEDLKITLTPGDLIFIGNTKKWWNQYHFMRIRVAEGVSAQTVHSALAKIGMPMALMPSRKEDIVREMQARSIGFRFPEIAYKDPHRPLPVDEMYAALSESQRAIVDHDVATSALTHVGNGHFEHVVPSIAQEAWKLGVRSVATFIWGGTSMNDTANVVKNIVKNGLLSSQERFQNGILGNGCCPLQNYQTGSSDQVFCRIFTKNLFEDNFKLTDFAIAGRVLIMLDPRVLERMPYSYTGDRNGVRNPDYYQTYFHAQKQEPIFGFHGKEMMQERLGFEKHVSELYRDAFPLNETMFDLNIGSNYIQKLVVLNKDDRLALVAALQKAGVYEIGGRPIEEVVVVSKALSPELVPSFYEENPYKELQNGAEYI